MHHLLVLVEYLQRWELVRNMLVGADEIDPYERQLLLVAKQQLENSPRLNETQKRIIEQKFQEIVDVYRLK